MISWRSQEEPPRLFVHHDAYLEKSFVKARTKADDIRAVKYLTAWCQSHSVPPTIEAISRKLAVRFMDDLGDLTGQLEAATQNKYLNRLSPVLAVHGQTRDRRNQRLGGIARGGEADAAQSNGTRIHRR